MKKLKRKFVLWLLKDSNAGLTITHNNLTGIKHLTFNIDTLVLSSIEMQEGIEIRIIKHPAKKL